MKYIAKQTEPQAFTKWKNQSNDNWQPSYSDIGSRLKDELKKALMQEQGYLCCYCEQRLIFEDCHIEHFRPQSDSEVDPLDYDNMLCSCQNLMKKGEPRHCGQLKGDWFDENLLISPLDPNCEKSFKFTLDGHIIARNDGEKSAINTIEKLGLNIPKLQDLRKKAIEPFLDENLSLEDINNFIKGYLSRTQAGEFNAFWTTIKYLESYLKLNQ